MRSAVPWLLSLACVLASCSPLAVKRLPGNFTAKAGSETELDCSDDLTYPLIDMVGTILAGVLAINLNSSDDREDFKTGIYISGAFAITFAGSAVYGAHHVNRCRRAVRGQGIVRPAPQLIPRTDTPRANESDVPVGTYGGPCGPEGACMGDLRCDPMGVCVPDEDQQ